MYGITFPLEITKEQKSLFSKRFFYYNKLKNSMIKRAQKLIRQLERDKEYMWARKQYGKLKEAKASKATLAPYANKMNEARKGIGLTNFDLKMWIRPMRRKYSAFISSQQGQAISDNVWRAVEDYLFAEGEALHFKRILETMSIAQTTNLNGVRVDLEEEYIEWLGERARFKVRHDEYVDKALKSLFKFGYIKRQMFDSGWRYYLTLLFEGDPPLRFKPRYKVAAGLDIGTSTIAFVSDKEAYLDNLSPRAIEYRPKLKSLDKKIDRKIRLANPDNYDKDGKIKKGASKNGWKISKRCRRLKRKRKALYRKQAATTLQSHREQLNKLLVDCGEVVIEPMAFKSLQKRSKKAERQEKATVINDKPVYKYKRKKRFGSSLGLHAPGKFIFELKRKCELYRIDFKEVERNKYKASQFNHMNREYEKTELRQRSKIINGTKVQRDLYSAYLIKNTNDSLESPNLKKCVSGFKKFVKLQNERIEYMKSAGISNRACFGF